MRKFNLFAAAALIAVPAMLVSSPVQTASQVPWINSAAGPVTQPNCPTGSRSGCFGPGIPTGVNAAPNAAGAGFTPVAPVSFCMQFMQAFLRASTNPGGV